MSAMFSTWGSAVPSVPGTPPSFTDDGRIRAFMGWDGIIMADEAVDIVDMTREVAERAGAESCGQCFPCRMGTTAMAEILNRICAGAGRADDIERLEHLALYVRDAVRCDIGKTSPKPILDALRHFRDRFIAAVTAGKARPRGEYIGRVTAPCIAACPAHVDIPGYVEQVRVDRPGSALDLVRQTCSLPGTVGRVCVHCCEAKCRRGRIDEQPVAIRALKCFAADHELAAGNVVPAECREKQEPREHKAAIIGAGPAGLSCAYYLGLMGYRAVIFEALPDPGGMAAVGIPDYRLPRHILRTEASWIEEVGVEIHYGVKVHSDVTVDELRSRGFAADFVAAGAPGSSAMGCEGEDAGYEGFMPGVEFLRRAAFGEQPLTGRKMAVIGGGNVAMDCVRTALRLGFDDVNLLYRRTVKVMPADPVEIEESQEEGVKFHTLLSPVKIVAADGRVTGIECVRMELGEPDASGRRRPVPVEGSTFVLDWDAVVPAIGQAREVDQFVPEGVKTGRGRTIVVDPVTMQSAVEYMFGGGDCHTGPSTLIAALAAGRRAARYIARYLETGTCEAEPADLLGRAVADLATREAEEPPVVSRAAVRQRPPVADPHERIKDFSEVEGRLSACQAHAEAERCTRCYRLVLAAVS
ncbi:MAG: FAD-dependent oxidoreductase [Deltaproteobacteria bacterium]|nr:FAD-dependent oxidoreductase [Candidatus Anaeroferrophillacea bacterium]